MNSTGANSPPGVPLLKDRPVVTIFSAPRTARICHVYCSMHGLIDGAVAGAHDLGELDADQSDQKSCGSRLKYCVHAGCEREFRPQVGDVFHERQRCEAANYSQAGVSSQFTDVLQMIGRNAEQRLIAQEPALDHRARDGGQHNGAQDARSPSADYLFDNEEYRGNGCS